MPSHEFTCTFPLTHFPSTHTHTHTTQTVYGSQGIPDYELRNFLIYVHGDMQKATERIEKCLAWRRQHFPIPRESVLKPLQQNIFSFQGFDLAGRPVGYFRLEEHDRKNRDIDQYVKAIVYQSEKLLERMGGNSNYRVTLVIDRRGANLFNQDLELYKAFFKIFADLYPMKLYRVLLYPATRVTRVLWLMLRPFVHSHVQRRLVLISANSKAEWEGFAPYIARGQLLEDFGGALKDTEAEVVEKKEK